MGFMELIENLLQLLVTFVGALLSGISYRKSGRQAYFLLLCFYGCFALGSLYWTLYLLLFDATGIRTLIHGSGLTLAIRSVMSCTSFSYVLLRLKGFIPTVTPAPGNASRTRNNSYRS